jgi:hypothetical protein
LTDEIDAAVLDFELAEFISLLIVRVGSVRDWTHDQYVLNRDYWPKHPLVQQVIYLLDNS